MDIKKLTFRYKLLVKYCKRNPKLIAFLLSLFKFFQGMHRKQETSQTRPCSVCLFTTNKCFITKYETYLLILELIYTSIAYYYKTIC